MHAASSTNGDVAVVSGHNALNIAKWLTSHIIQVKKLNPPVHGMLGPSQVNSVVATVTDNDTGWG